jgi:predicted Zn-dependent protease with MMP-like domain
MNISREKFEQFVSEALDSLPEKYQRRMNNVAVFVEEQPTREQLSRSEKKSGFVLFGIFEGYGQSSKVNFGPVLPDRITIFKGPICQYYDTEEKIKAQVFSTLKHEIAHHFGSDEKGAKKAQKN